jgi:DNA mismatch repair protein MutL
VQYHAFIKPGPARPAAVEDFEEDETPLQAEIKPVSYVCKRAWSGRAVLARGAARLLADLETRCRVLPHGRPTMIHLSVDLLERQFGREAVLVSF